MGSVTEESNKLIRLSKSCLGNAEKDAVIGVLDREFLGMGKEVQQFEEMLMDYFEKPVVCVSSGTAALHISLQAVGVGFGDEVLVQALTYVASFQAISSTGAIPVACDVEADTLCLDWRDAEKRLTPNTKAVMPVHYAGGVGVLDNIYAFAEKYGLRVIEDAAHAFGTNYQGKKVGSFGDIVCFSFDGIKNITSGEGGCIVTDDKLVLQKIRDARLLGVERDSDKRYSGDRSWDFDVTAQGWRYHMSNIMAAIGIEQLKRFPEMAKKRRLLAKKYDEILFKNKSLDLLKHDYSEVVPHIYVVIISGRHSRQYVREQLSKHGIQTGIHYKPNHWLSAYKSRKKRIKTVETFFPSILSLPLHPDMKASDVEFICKTLNEILE